MHRYRIALANVALLLALTACVRDPQRVLATQLLLQLDEAAGRLSQDSGDLRAPCDTAGEVRAKLYTESGPRDSHQAWEAMRTATDHLLAACGQLRLLQESYRPGVVVDAARERWRTGAAGEVGSMCQQLRVAESAFATPLRGCGS